MASRIAPPKPMAKLSVLPLNWRELSEELDAASVDQNLEQGVYDYTCPKSRTDQLAIMIVVGDGEDRKFFFSTDQNLIQNLKL